MNTGKMPAYSGTAPFVFVSYAHDDSKIVYPIINELMSGGYRIWYDEGIAPTDKWRGTVNTHIENCAVFMIFVTDKSTMRSEVIRECNYAINLHKKLHIVYLEDVPKEKIDSSLRAEFSVTQCLIKNNETYDSFKRKLRMPIESLRDKVCIQENVTQRQNNTNTDRPSNDAGISRKYGSAVKTNTITGGEISRKFEDSISVKKHRKVPILLVFVSILMLVGISGLLLYGGLKSYENPFKNSGVSDEAYDECMKMTDRARRTDIVEQMEKDKLYLVNTYENMRALIPETGDNTTTDAVYRRCCYTSIFAEFMAQKEERLAENFSDPLYKEKAETQRAYADRISTMLHSAKKRSDLNDIVEYSRENNLFAFDLEDSQ